jgi:hypothetical protein
MSAVKALGSTSVELKVEEDGDLVTSPVSLSVKYLRNRSGVRFAQRFLVGLQHGFRFTLALRRS